MWDGESISTATRRGLAGRGVLQLWHSSRLRQTHSIRETPVGTQQGAMAALMLRAAPFADGVRMLTGPAADTGSLCELSVLRWLPGRRQISVNMRSAFAGGAGFWVGRLQMSGSCSAFTYTGRSLYKICNCPNPSIRVLLGSETSAPMLPRPRDGAPCEVGRAAAVAHPVHDSRRPAEAAVIAAATRGMTAGAG